MNSLQSHSITSPFNETDKCARFVVDDVAIPFVMYGVAAIGHQYTLSFWLKSEAAGNLTACGATFPSTTTWAKHSVTFTASEEDIALSFVTAGTYYLYHPQLELGNKATDWSPSPDDAQTAFNNLESRITVAETNIRQNAEQIALLAAKTVSEQILDEYYTREETNAAITLEADSIRNAVSVSIETVKSTADQASESATEANERVTTAESLIQQLSNCIAMLVTDENGESLMTQTDDGWTFSMKETSEAVSSLTTLLEALQQETGSTQATVETLLQTISDHGERMEYVNISTYENEPCIELGESDSDFKLLITNTRIMFMNGGNVPTYINTNGLVTQNIEVQGEIVQGGYVMLNTSDGGWGLLWKGVGS